MRRCSWIACTLFSLAAPAVADEVRYFEKDGVTYQETRRVIRRPITETKYEAREQTIYREKYSTDLQASDRKYMAPVTEYRWEPQWVTPWNPFSAPYVTYRWAPVTRWVEKNETVKIPITRREVVPETVTTNVPTTTQRFVDEEHISRVVVSKQPNGTMIAAPTTPYTPPAYTPTKYVPPSYGQALPGPGSSSDVASRDALGGVHRLENDPPRQGGWRPANSYRR